MKRGEERPRLPLESLAEPPIAQHEFRGHRSLLVCRDPQRRCTGLCEFFHRHYSPLTTIWPRISTWTVQASSYVPGGISGGIRTVYDWPGSTNSPPITLSRPTSS